MYTINDIELIDSTIDQVFHIAMTTQIERTKTNQQLNRLEDEYYPKFLKLFDKITTEYFDRNYMIFEAERKYRTQVQTLIKSLVFRTFLLGLDYVSRAMNKPEVILLTPNDLILITQQSDQVYALFWRSINKYLQVIRNRKSKLMRIAQENKEPEDENVLLQITTMARLILNAILTPILAFSTIQTFRRVQQQDNVFANDPSTIQGAKMVFITEKDSLVCPICLPFNNKEWDPNSLGIIIPRVHTHPNCRCRLLLKINGKIISK